MCATRQTAACSFKYSGLGRGRLGSVDVNVMIGLAGSEHRVQSVSIILPDIRGHSMQTVNQPLTTMCSNHKRRLSKGPCNDTSIVNPFSRLWIFSPSSWLRISIDLKLLMIAQTHPAYFFCDTLNVKKQPINEKKLAVFSAGSFGSLNS
jgi:hypothetical protein